MLVLTIVLLWLSRSSSVSVTGGEVVKDTGGFIDLTGGEGGEETIVLYTLFGLY